jgi:trehalose 6-phosphate synthase
MVNPNDIEGMAEAINRAIVMPEAERRSRMRRMRQNVRRENIFWWTDSFLRAGASKRLDDFPVSEYFMPKEPARPSLI